MDAMRGRKEREKKGFINQLNGRYSTHHNLLLSLSTRWKEMPNSSRRKQEILVLGNNETNLKVDYDGGKR